MASLYLMVLVGHTPLVVGGNSFLCPSQILNRSKTVDFGKLSLKILLLYVWVRLHDLFSVRNFVCNNKHIFDFISAFYYFMHMRVKTICEFTVHAEF